MTQPAGSSARCSTATTLAITSDILLEPVAGDAPEKFDQLVTFDDVHDLDPGHEASA